MVNNYTQKVKFSSTNNYGCVKRGEDDVYTVAEFKDMVECGGFVDYDGHGYPVKDSMAHRSIIIKPSRLQDIPECATHIVWYNK